MTYNLLLGNTSTETSIDEFRWTRQATLLLLNLYREKHGSFRNSKIKNKDIWLEILKKFENQGYNSITIEILDRKLRNLKKTYKDNKDKKNKTGESCIKWEYFEIMDDIFFNDKTMNPTHTISSMQSIPNDFSSKCEVGLRNETLENHHGNDQNPNMVESNKDNKFDEESTNVKKINKSSTTRVKQLYEHRKKIQEIEKQRLEEIKRLREAIVRNNEIQQEINYILRQVLLTLNPRP